MGLVCSTLWLCILKNGHIHEGGKVETSNATPTKLFSVDSYDLKSLSFKLGNDIFITFEMPRVAYNRLVLKINISLLFCPSVIRGPWLNQSKYWVYSFICIFSSHSNHTAFSQLWILKERAPSNFAFLQNWIYCQYGTFESEHEIQKLFPRKRLLLKQY